MSFDSNQHGNDSSNLTANLTKRKGKKSDRNGQYSNGAHLPDVQMVPKIRVVSGGYEPVTVIQEDRSASDLENGDAFAQTDEHQLENGHLVEQNFENEIGDAKAKEETSFTIAFEVLIPFLIAGLGTVGAGLLLDKVQHDDVFEQISEIFILVPALLGLKGNLEMTLASRLSTAANVGSIDSKSEQWKLITGNMVLIQVCKTINNY
ncbi:Solute carrier family 41 member 1 [Paramuricea clavata]|uniref:Solute carrier family 41 member 1 n=2 Tax=Paramuricea clavata TaxID=317549 RepID=A0A7D9M5T4_PARCT|nr:Solute carrier family 41 member 1 [Paramuricea clavata]